MGQKPDALFIACSDSRMAINVFASTDPGDLFVVRNVGNLASNCGLWFDMLHLDVLYYEERAKRWSVLDDGERSAHLSQLAIRT